MKTIVLLLTVFFALFCCAAVAQEVQEPPRFLEVDGLAFAVEDGGRITNTVSNPLRAGREVSFLVHYAWRDGAVATKVVVYIAGQRARMRQTEQILKDLYRVTLVVPEVFVSGVVGITLGAGGGQKAHSLGVVGTEKSE